MGNNITHNCLQCNPNYSYEININNYLNCYNNSNYEESTLLYESNSIFLNETTKLDISTFSIYENYLKTSKIEISSSSIKENFSIKSLIDLMKSEYFENSNFTSKEINKKIYEQLIDIFIENFKDFEGEEQIIEGKDNHFFQLTTLEDELDSIEGKNNNTNNFSKIDLGECADILREKNNYLSLLLSLLLLQSL